MSKESTAPKSTEEAPECKHYSWKRVNTSSPEADGIDESYSGEYICNDCNKVLAKGYSNISATWNEIYDGEWAKRNEIEAVEY